MEENKIEEIVDETTQETKSETPEKVEEPKKENVTKENLKKFKTEVQEQSVTKVDLTKPIEDSKEEIIEEKPVEETEEEIKEEAVEETEDTPVIEEIKGNEKEKVEVEELATEAGDAIEQSMNTGKPLPENIQKVVDFMEETGGDLIDYVRLNQDYGKLDDNSVLREYYKQTKGHLNDEEINFLMEDTFSYDADVDEEREIKRKKLALKEQVAGARAHLDRQKSKYYAEIKAGSKLSPEQQKAVNFFDRYKKTTEDSQKQGKLLAGTFDKKTNELFGDKFKGFEYNVGDKRFRFNVNNTKEIKDAQSDVNNFVRKFLNKKTGALEDAAGYHKSLFTAMNSDAIAKHFYEQGKADAMKNSITKSKNIDMSPRQSHGEAQNIGGPTFKVLGDDSTSFKWKINKK